MIPVAITTYVGTEMTIEYDMSPRVACHIKTSGYDTSDVELLPDEAIALINQLERFLVLAAQHDPLEFREYVPKRDRLR